jgi:Peptidase A4 family
LLTFVTASRLLAAVAGLAASVAVATGFAIANAPAAKAAQVDPTQGGVSSNWAGYVASGTDATSALPAAFSTVSGTWVEPKANCSSVSSTGPTSSAFWVGLGGNATSSNALEQTGTEADCSSSGATYFAWYELVPAGSVKLRLKVDPGNKISASVSVNGTHVSVLMRNLTQGTTVSKTLPMADPDTSSAEWIAEAPSVCGASYYHCSEQSLTNFGTVAFSSASAESDGHTGSISDPSWTSTPIELQTGGSGGYFGAGRGFGPEESVAEALPSTLTQNGSAFSITWHELTAPEPSGGYGGGGYGGGGYGGGGYGGGGSYSV